VSVIFHSVFTPVLLLVAVTALLMYATPLAHVGIVLLCLLAEPQPDLLKIFQADAAVVSADYCMLAVLGAVLV
jgi:hypothetical protein